MATVKGGDRCAAQRRRRRRRERSRRRAAGHALHALASGALALPGIAGADTPLTGFSSSYRYSFYSEDDMPAAKVTAGGETRRYEIHTHQFNVQGPVAERMDLGLDVAYETMSGATPWYVVPGANGEPIQVMTGATIEEQRTDALLSGNWYFDRGRAGLGTGVSIENDYLAFNGKLDGERHFNDKNTTVSGGLGFSIDRIEPTDAELFAFRPEREDKQSFTLHTGGSQILGRGANLQSNLTYQHSRGFLSDPYKRVLVEGTPVGDSRPDQRNQIAWLTRYRQHLDGLGASVHLDYRFHVDDWEIYSHTIEAAWYQTLFGVIRVIPALRYYSQSQAKFYAPWFVSAPADGHYSSDYRLSPYGALSYRVKAETLFHTWNVAWRGAVSFERYESSGDLALGKVSVEAPGLVSFNLISVSLSGRF